MRCARAQLTQDAISAEAEQNLEAQGPVHRLAATLKILPGLLEVALQHAHLELRATPIPFVETAHCVCCMRPLAGGSRLMFVKGATQSFRLCKRTSCRAIYLGLQPAQKIALFNAGRARAAQLAREGG